VDFLTVKLLYYYVTWDAALLTYQICWYYKMLPVQGFCLAVISMTIILIVVNILAQNLIIIIL